LLLLLLLPLLPVFIVQLIISSAFADVETVAFELAAAWLTHADGARVFGRLVRDIYTGGPGVVGLACSSFGSPRRHYSTVFGKGQVIQEGPGRYPAVPSGCSPTAFSL
jgi:hypothetical protein